MSRLVMKFGGTSVADLDRIANAAQKVAAEVANGHEVIVIVSAMSGKTNELVGWVRDSAPEDGIYDRAEYDAVVSSGENVTSGLMALRLQQMGVQARSFQGWQVPVQCTGHHEAARIDAVTEQQDFFFVCLLHRGGRCACERRESEGDEQG